MDTKIGDTGVTVGAAVGIAVAGVLLYGYWKTSRAGYESAPYTVIRKEGAFEIRDYPKMTIIETLDKEGRGNGFRKLFKFITGTNENKQKISMTTPVYMHQNEGHEKMMAFVMPASMSIDQVP